VGYQIKAVGKRAEGSFIRGQGGDFEMFLGAGVLADPSGFRNAVNLKRRRKRR
jgi:hypothetical protein